MSDAQRLHDIELAVLELARIVEHVLIANTKLKGAEREKLLYAIDHVRVLCTPETSDGPDDDPPAAGALLVQQGWSVPRGYLALEQGGNLVCLFRTRDCRTEFCASQAAFGAVLAGFVADTGDITLAGEAA